MSKILVCKNCNHEAPEEKWLRCSNPNCDACSGDGSIGCPHCETVFYWYLLDGMWPKVKNEQA